MITIIAVVSENGTIGKNGKISWQVPSDQQHLMQSFPDINWNAASMKY